MARDIIFDNLLQGLLEGESSDEDPAENLLPALVRPRLRVDLQCVNNALNGIAQHERTNVLGYVEDVVPLYSPKEFVMHFRLKRTLVLHIITRFQASPEFSALQGHGGFAPVSADKHVLIFLWFVGHEAAGYRDVADRFDISLSALHSVIRRMSVFFVRMSNTVIKNSSIAELAATKAYYLEKRGFPDILGVIDGSHIRIDKPTEDPESYINRKKYFSIQMQGIVNEKGKFFDVFIGYPGSVHDARVYRNSPIFAELPNICQGQGYLLGDSAYPCSSNLITPYRDNGHLTRAQRQFNYVHSSCRITVEHAFGWLKQRFRQLYHVKLRSVEDIVLLIHACCVLHNMADQDDLEGFEEPLPDDHPDEDINQRNEGEGALGIIDNLGDPVDGEAGKILRDEICRQLVRLGEENPLPEQH